MNKWSKVGLTVGMGTAVIVTTHLINKIIFQSSASQLTNESNNKHSFPWKFGEVTYTVNGTGSPLLLIHDLTATSSSYEWSNVIDELSKNYTVYAIDMLGCGESDKPNITYTTYMYTQLLNDFVINVIKEKTDVIATGNTAPVVLMSAYNNSIIFDKIILVNPQSIKSASKVPGKRSNIRRKLLNSPIIGTMIYNICMSKPHVRKFMLNNNFYSLSEIPDDYITVSNKNAHLGSTSAKFFFSSESCNYLSVNINNAVNRIDNCIFILSGSEEKNHKEINIEYINNNPAIETSEIEFSKHLPQLEQPEEFVKNALIFLN